MQDKEVSVKLLPRGKGENKTDFILGRTGSGKTTIIANLLLHVQRWVIFDVKGDFTAEFFGEEVVTINKLSEFADALNNGKHKILFDLQGFTNDVEQYLDAALLQLYEFQKANVDNPDLPPITMVLDELNRFVSTHTNDMPGLSEMIQRGRGFAIQKIFGAQWFGTIPTWVRDSFSAMWVFRHNDKRGLLLLEDYGFDPEEVKNLPQYTCLHLTSGGIERLTIVPDAIANQNTQPLGKIESN